MHVIEEFVLSFFQETRGGSRILTAIGIKSLSNASGGLVEDVAIDGPAQQGFERMAVQASDLDDHNNNSNDDDDK